jgi:DNA replication and repair protein RecF
MHRRNTPAEAGGRVETTTAGAAGEAAALSIARLSLQGYRNLRQAELDCDPRPVVLIGANGAGKSNLLEALSLLTPGRGLRRARLADLVPRLGSNQGPASQGWAVAARVRTPEGPRDLGTGRDPAAESGNGERRLMKVDGDFVTNQKALGEVLSAVWLTPSMDGLFLEGPTARRRFLDRLVYAFDPAHAGRLSAYERALRDRARLLAAGSADSEWLAALEWTMAERAVAVAAARRDCVAELAGACVESRGPFPQAGLGLAGEVESWLETAPAVEVEERLRQVLAEARGRDAKLGGAAVGVHRSDLVVRHLARGQPAALCSTGEQKALLISIVLAHARLRALAAGAAPLLLLDEIAAHLDQQRREALYDELLALGAQAWMSGTDSTLFAPFGPAAQRFVVHEGAVLREA